MSSIRIRSKLQALKFHLRSPRFAGWLMTALLTLCIAPSASAQFVSNLSYYVPACTAPAYYGQGIPYTVVVGNFNKNNNNNADLAVLSDYCINIFLGNGDGTFSTGANYEDPGGSINSIAVGDFNGDGRPDLIVAGSSNLFVLLGNGDGTFTAGAEYTAALVNPALAVGDFNNDGHLDVALAGVESNGNGVVLVFLGNGDGTFQQPASYPAGTQGVAYLAQQDVIPVAIVVGDFNGDGKLDIVTGNSNLFGARYLYSDLALGSLSVLLGKGDGTFQPVVNYDILNTVGFSWSMVAQDFNGDGNLDLALADFQNNVVAVLNGNGDGTFANAVDYPAGTATNGIAVGDFFGTGYPDLVVSNWNSSNIQALRNNGTGQFTTAGTFPVSGSYAAGAGVAPTGLAVGNFNVNTLPDVAVALYYGNEVEILLNGGSASSGGSGGGGSGSGGSGTGGSGGSGSGGSGSCSCSLTGDYVNPAAPVAPTFTVVDQQTLNSPSGKYTATFIWSQPNQTTTVSVINNLNNTVAFPTQTLPYSTNFGFSPDDDRFVFNYTDTTSGLEEAYVYDLTSKSNLPIVYTALATSEAKLEFSPSGRFFMFAGLVNPSTTTLQIYRVQGVTSQDLVYNTQYTFEDLGASKTDLYGGVDWGFGPGSPETSFVYAYATGQTSFQWTLVNLASGQTVQNVSLNNIADYWQFNPCGNVAALISQTSDTQVEIDLYNTNTGAALSGSGGNYDAPITLETTSSGEEIEYSGQTSLLSASICGQANTSTGSNSAVSPMDSGTSTSPVQLTVSSITQAGQTTLTITSTPPSQPTPTDFQLGNPPVYYDISTTAVFAPPVTICINYGGITFINPSQIQLFHYTNGAWVNITTTVNTTTQTVCGSTTSFSPFALVEPSSPLPQTVTASLGSPQQATINTTFATPLQATVTDTNGNLMPGIPVTFFAPWAGPTGIFTGIGALATVTTGANGVAIAPALTADGFAGAYTVTASVTGVPNPANFLLTNSAATPSISWIPASPITYGTPLGASQLDATTSVPGNFVYNPSAGATLAAGTQTLSTTFTPTDTTDYTTATANAVITVTPAPLTITASSGSMIYGGPVFPVTPGYNGFANGDTPASLTSPPTCATTATSASPVGTYSSYCSGASDPNYTIGYANGAVSVTQATTTTAVVSSDNPSTYMQLVTLTATVTPQYAGTVPTGTVTFYNNGTSIGIATLTVASCGTPPCPDQASFSTASLPDSGPDSITAVYSGDGNFLSSTSPAITQTVQPTPIVSLNPMFLSFGNQNANTTSLPAPITLTNIGDAALSLGANAISISGANAGEFAQTSNCGSTLAAGSNCTINVVFKPVDTGVATAALQITDNDDNTSGAQQSVSLTGSGLSTIIHRSLFGYGIFATGMRCNSIMMSGGSTVDSFDSSLGFSSSHTLSGGNVGTNGNVTLSGSNTVIYGTAATGSCGSTWGGEGQVSGGLVGLSGQVIYPAGPTPNPPTTAQNIAGSCGSLSGCTSLGTNAVSLAPGQYGNLSISGGTTVQLSAGIYNLNSLRLNGNSILYVSSGPVLINLAGASLSGFNPAMDLSGGSIQNPSGIPANLQFTYGGSGVVNLSGGSASYATVYAPNALVNIIQGSDFFGAIVGSIVTNTGGVRFHYDRNLPNILAGSYIWFTAVINNVAGLPSSGQVKLYLTDSTISFTAGGTSYNLPVPNGVITFNSSSVTIPTTIYDLTNSRWNTQVPASGLTGNTFVTGLAFPVPANFPSGIQNVQWSAAFTTDTPGIKLQWQWAAAVYSSFSTTYATSSNSNILGVNAEDGSADTNGGDPAGTPETYKASLIFGATGSGWNNYTGFFSPTAYVIPTTAPVSVSPSGLDFGTQAQGTTSAPLTAILTNNDSSAYTISSITVTGTNASDFSTSNCPSSLASGASCTLTVTFTPSDVGTETAEIVINDNAKNTPQTIYLTGTGQ